MPMFLSQISGSAVGTDAGIASSNPQAPHIQPQQANGLGLPAMHTQIQAPPQHAPPPGHLGTRRTCSRDHVPPLPRSTSYEQSRWRG